MQQFLLYCVLIQTLFNACFFIELLILFVFSFGTFLLLNMKNLIIVCFFFFAGNFSVAQSYIRVQTLLPSYYPAGNPNALVETRKLTKDASLVFQPGIDFSYVVHTSPTLGVGVNKVLFLNTSNRINGAFRLQLVVQLLKSYKHTLNVGVGPAFHYRTDEPEISIYSDQYLYTNSGTGFDYKVMWLSGELVYNYTITKKTDLSISFNHTEPEAVSLTAGFRYWISKKAKGKACNCPTFKR